MTPPLRDRLAQILAAARPSIDFPAWGPMARDRDHWREIADALLASEEWQAREAVVEAAQLRATLGDARAHHILTCSECERLEADEDRWCDEAAKLARQGLDASLVCRATLARLDAGREKEPDNHGS